MISHTARHEGFNSDGQSRQRRRRVARKWKILTVLSLIIGGLFWHFGVEKYSIPNSTSYESVSPSKRGSVFVSTLERPLDWIGFDTEVFSFVVVHDPRAVNPHWQKLTRDDDICDVLWSFDGKIVGVRAYFPVLNRNGTPVIDSEGYQVRDSAHPLWVAAYDFSATAPIIFQRCPTSKPTRLFNAKIAHLMWHHGGLAEYWQNHLSDWKLSQWTWRDRELKAMIPKKWD